MRTILVSALAAVLLALPGAMPATAGHYATLKKGKQSVEIHTSRSNPNAHWVSRNGGPKRKVTGKSPKAAKAYWRGRGYK